MMMMMLIIDLNLLFQCDGWNRRKVLCKVVKAKEDLGLLMLMRFQLR
jgi:hypothetical protein